VDAGGAQQQVVCVAGAGYAAKPLEGLDAACWRCSATLASMLVSLGRVGKSLPWSDIAVAYAVRQCIGRMSDFCTALCLQVRGGASHVLTST
jgi:hypothetical protein